VLKRHQLGLSAAGVLSRINSDLSLSTLGSSWRGEALCSTEQRNRLFLSSANQWGHVTGGRSYDGTLERNWGVLAPGASEIVAQAIDDVADWASSADAVHSTNTVVTRDGVVAIGADHTVIVDLGIAQGVEPGDFLTIYRYAAGREYGIRPVGAYWVTLPPPAGVVVPRTYLGEIGILQVGDRWAIGRVTDSYRMILVGDEVELK